MERTPLISVIIPVYNVETYLDRCVQSVVNQEYSILDIILVDDGSTDSSGRKCDEWSAKDNRIRVIHKKNGGLSSARNCGIEAAAGEYFAFVDSDDWIHKSMIRSMVHYIDCADVVCCGLLHATDEHSVPAEWFTEPVCLNKEQFLDLLVENKRVTSHVWNKLYPREVFACLRFPEGRLYEDIHIAHKIFQRVERVFVLPQAYYYYYSRNNSISNVVKLRNQLEWMYALRERAEDLKGDKPQYQNMIHAQMAVAISLALVQNSYTEQEKNACNKELDDVQSFLRDRYVGKAVAQYATRKQQLFYWLARVLSWHANAVYRLFKQGLQSERK